jgi:hypothetical protein
LGFAFVAGFVSLLLTAGAARALPVSISGTNAQGRPFRLEEERGRVVAITLVSRYTRDELARINEALKAEVGPDVLVVTVVDLTAVPRLFRALARHRVAQQALADRVQFVIDDSGRWSSTLGAVPDERVDIIVLDRGGELRGHFVGWPEVERARQLIRDLRAGLP